MKEKVTLESALADVITNARNPIYNYVLARKYDDIGQTSAALSYYLRAAEFAPYTLLAYESMMRVAQCLMAQGDRWFHVRGTLLRAVSMQPKRPEAYYLLARAYQVTREWEECHTICKIAEAVTTDDQEPLRTDIGYPGKYFFTFQRGVVGWELGQIDETLHILYSLRKRTDISIGYMEAVENDLKNVGNTSRPSVPYLQEHHSQLRYKFPGSANIGRNYSQAYQDMFVLSLLNGKRNGRYVEIGSGHSTKNSNTYLLETEYDWTGLSIDIDEKTVKEFNQNRFNRAIVADAVTIDYTDILPEGDYDYLQVDCEPPAQTLAALQHLPLDKVRFAVITFEHDAYAEREEIVREQSRKYLQSYGYQLVVDNIAEDRWACFEDWWVHPALVNPQIVKRMLCVDGKTKKAGLYMLDKL